jgi:hypothetical protein
MSTQLDPRVQIEWIVAPDDLDADWQHAECCMALHQDADSRPAIGDEDEWWPGRCIL